MVKTGCHRALLPKEFRLHKTVHDHLFPEDGPARDVGADRPACQRDQPRQEGRAATASSLRVDSQCEKIHCEGETHRVRGGEKITRRACPCGQPSRHQERLRAGRPSAAGSALRQGCEQKWRTRRRRWRRVALLYRGSGIRRRCGRWSSGPTRRRAECNSATQERRFRATYARHFRLHLWLPWLPPMIILPSGRSTMEFGSPSVGKVSSVVSRTGGKAARTAGSADPIASKRTRQQTGDGG